MPYPTFHSARINDPDKYPKKRYGKDEFGTGIDVIWGITDAGKTEVQAIRFDKTKFTIEEARAWLKKHPEHKVISFEAATGGTAKTQKVSDPFDRFQRTLWDLQQDTPGYARVHYCPSCRLNKVEGHDAILQGLDRKVGKLFFGKTPFLPTVDDWNGIPQIFSKIHPDPVKFDQDPEAELTRIGGGITGELSDAALETIGRARLMARKNYTDETAFKWYDAGKISVDTLNRSLAAIPESLRLITEGKLSHSTAFICPDDGESLYGIVRPNHILDFEETPVDQPVDQMAVILNKQENENVIEGNAQLQIGKVISSKNEGKLRAAMDAFRKFFEDILTGGEEPAPLAEPTVTAKTQAATVVKAGGGITAPDGESLEGQIELIRQGLSNKVGMTYSDGSRRTVWTVMTLPDKVIWQNPDTMKYYSTPYTLTGENVTFNDSVEVEQAYVVKTAKMIFTGMTPEDIETITRRNKMGDTPTEDPKVKDLTDQVAKLNKELEDAKVALKTHEDAKALEKKNKFDADWANLKKTVIPPGEVKDPADEAKLQKMSVEEPLVFAAKIAEWRKAPGLKQEGTSHMQGPGGDANDSLAAIRELRAATGRIKRR